MVVIVYTAVTMLSDAFAANPKILPLVEIGLFAAERDHRIDLRRASRR
jgi:hypothetical protein